MRILPCTFIVLLWLSLNDGADSNQDLTQRAKAVLAQIEGDITLPGLKEPVEVLRDRWGVPHIYAKNADDLFFAQGFTAAQDRLFQLDMWRRIAVGEMAEVMGPEAIEADRFSRLLRYRGDMDAEWASYSPDTKRIATAFTSGINACIDHVGKRLPIEFQILGFAPGKWQPEDILGRMSGIIMTGNIQREIARARLIAFMGVERTRALFPTDPVTKFAPAEGLELASIDDKIMSGYKAATKLLQFKPVKTESNNWVVSGERSQSGKPMLASDPHRAVTLPSLRYLVHLNAPGWNVIGAGEPALPGVALGHNERIAWGITIVGTDQADLYVEETDVKDANRYKTDAGFEQFRVVKEKIKVKGKAPTEVELRFSRHGPVIHQDVKRNRAFALKWVGSEPGAAAYLGGVAVSRAENWAGFLKALESWKIPSLNFVYADIDGNIGWVANGLTPIRKNHDGLLPVPGHSGSEWQGFLKVKEQPHLFNPASGAIATANHNILPAAYKHTIAYDWAEGYRNDRVQQRLDAKKKLTLDDFRDIQHENTSLPGQVLVRLVKSVDMKDAKLEPFVKLLAGWDGVLSRESAAGPLHAAWIMEIQESMYRSKVPKELLASAQAVGNMRVLLTALEKADANWFGDNPKEDRDRLVRVTFSAAVDKVKSKLGPDPAKWSWGKLHIASFRHPLATMGKEYEKAFNLGPVGRPGDALTPNNTRHDEKFRQLHGATYRQVFDLTDWDRGLATSAPGQSGQPGSPHYGDLSPLWAEAQYFPLAYSRKKVEEVTQHRLRLKPQ